MNKQYFETLNNSKECRIILSDDRLAVKFVGSQSFRAHCRGFFGGNGAMPITHMTASGYPMTDGFVEPSPITEDDIVEFWRFIEEAKNNGTYVKVWRKK